jgi:hypothetical protein
MEQGRDEQSMEWRGEERGEGRGCPHQRRWRQRPPPPTRCGGFLLLLLDVAASCSSSARVREELIGVVRARGWLVAARLG